MKLIGKNFKEAAKIKNSQGSDMSLSKVVQLGTTYRLFVNLDVSDIKKPDLMVAVVPGRKLDYDALGATYIPLSDFDLTEEGKVYDKSGLARYAKVSRALLVADEAMEIAAVEEEQRKTAERMGTQVDQVALQTAIEAIRVKYHGNDKKGNEKVYATVNQAISGVVITAAAQVLVVPVDKTGAPDFSQAKTASLELSNARAEQITSLINNPDYCNPANGYLEINYAYNGTDKKAAGRNAVFQGVSESVSLKSKYPTIWEEEGKSALSRLAKNAEGIAARNLNMSSNITVDEVIRRFEKWISTKRLAMTYLDTEDDIVKNAAQDFVELGLVEDNPKLKAKFIEVMGTKDDEDVEDVDQYAKQASEALGIDSLGSLNEAVSDIDAIQGGLAEL